MSGFFFDELWAVDEALFRLINSKLTAQPLDTFFHTITDASNYHWPFLIGAALLLLLGRKKGLAAILMALAAVVLDEWIGGGLLKPLAARPRPCQVLPEVNLLIGSCSRSFSFPSGHATNSFSIAAVLAGFYGWYAAPVLAFAALVAYSRVYVGVHYPLDVAAGAVLGAGVAIGLWIAATRAWYFLKTQEMMERSKI